MVPTYSRHKDSILQQNLVTLSNPFLFIISNKDQSQDKEIPILLR